jgi:hypothetical protein
VRPIDFVEGDDSSGEREGSPLNILQIVGDSKSGRHQAGMFVALRVLSLDRRHKVKTLLECLRLKTVVSAIAKGPITFKLCVSLPDHTWTVPLHHWTVKIMTDLKLEGNLDEYIVLALNHDGRSQRVVISIQFQIGRKCRNSSLDFGSKKEVSTSTLLDPFHDEI